MYVAPEIVGNLAYQGADVDIFSYGSMLLILRTMTYPFVKASLDKKNDYDENYDSLLHNPAKFWKIVDKKANEKLHVSPELKNLIYLLL